jgi:hypothetical protein
MENLMKRFLFVAALIPTLVACAVHEEDFPEAYGEAICTQIESCNDDYADIYETDEDCVDLWAVAGDLILFGGNLTDQEYSAKGAGACARNIKRASCDDFEDGDYECEVFE